MSAPARPQVVAADRDEGLALWIVTFGTIVLWLVHVGAEISLAGQRDSHPWARWVMDGLTIVLALAAGWATYASWRIVTRHRRRESDPSPTGRTAFLGWMGVFIGSCNLLLIVLEGVYLVTVHG